MAQVSPGVKRTFLEILRDAAVSLGVDIAFKELTKAAAPKVSEAVTKKVLTDKRAELLEDFRIMETIGTRKDVANLLRRHRQSIKELREDRFVTLLCKIPCDPKKGRRPTLRYLNNLDDENFEQRLCMLDNDIVLQTLERIWRSGGRIMQRDLEIMRSALYRFSGVASKGIREGFRQADSGATAIAPILGNIANWLEERGGK